jgi:phosphoribosylformimino-5-aminoimidazole carboxamide ribotide isomerase
MIVIPAIDLKGGKCVRLFQGDYDKVTVFSDNPAEMAKQWVEQGASYLHLVDLDGAAIGRSENLEAVEAILNTVQIPCELGGGLRDIESIAALISLGIDRVILGTVALENPLLVAEACQLWPGRIVVGIDALKGMVATRGWKQVSHIKALDLAKDMVSYGVARIIYTDIERDGTLTQPNYEETAEMVKRVDVPVIASGGVASLENIEGLLPTGAEAVIVGRALYDGKLNLAEAIRLAEGREV